MGSSFTDTMGGLGHGLAGLVGAGSAYDPMGDLNTDLANANANTEMQPVREFPLVPPTWC